MINEKIVPSPTSLREEEEQNAAVDAVLGARDMEKQVAENAVVEKPCEDEPSQHLSSLRLYMIIVGLSLSVLLIALVRQSLCGLS